MRRQARHVYEGHRLGEDAFRMGSRRRALVGGLLLLLAERTSGAFACAFLR